MENDSLVKVDCKPDDRNLDTLYIPSRSEETTFECVTNLTNYFGITWSTVCNNQVECYDGLDERDCKFSSWLIPSLVCGAAIFLSFALSFYILRKTKKTVNVILQDRQWRLVTCEPIDNKVTKLFKIASLTQKKKI